MFGMRRVLPPSPLLVLLVCLGQEAAAQFPPATTTIATSTGTYEQNIVWQDEEVPVYIDAGYDPTCDYRSENFTFTNRAHLEAEGMPPNRWYSLEGIAKIVFVFFQVGVTIFFAPKIPLDEMGAWKPNKEEWTSARERARHMSLTQEQFVRAFATDMLFSRSDEEGKIVWKHERGAGSTIFGSIAGDIGQDTIRTLTLRPAKSEIMFEDLQNAYTKQRSWTFKTIVKSHATEWSLDGMEACIDRWLSKHMKQDAELAWLWIQLAADKAKEIGFGIDAHRAPSDYYFHAKTPDHKVKTSSGKEVILGNLIPGSGSRHYLDQERDAIISKVMKERFSRSNHPWTLQTQTVIFFLMCSYTFVVTLLDIFFWEPGLFGLWQSLRQDHRWFLLTFRADFAMDAFHMFLQLGTASYMFLNFMGGRSGLYGIEAHVAVLVYNAFFIVKYLPFVPMGLLTYGACAVFAALLDFTLSAFKMCKSDQTTAWLKWREAGGIDLDKGEAVLRFFVSFAVFPVLGFLTVSTLIGQHLTPETYLCSFGKLTVVNGPNSIVWYTGAMVVAIVVPLLPCFPKCCGNFFDAESIYKMWVTSQNSTNFLKQVPGFILEHTILFHHNLHRYV